MKQPFFCLACWSAYVPLQLSGNHCGTVFQLHTLCCRQRPTRYTQRGLCVTDASGKLDHWLMLCYKHEPHYYYSCLPCYSSRRHCFQYGHFIGFFTSVNWLYFCLTRQNFHFWPGRPFTRVPQMLPACQTRWVTLVHTWGPHSVCVCNKSTCVEKILHQVLKTPVILPNKVCVAHSFYTKVNDALRQRVRSVLWLEQLPSISHVLFVCVFDNPSICFPGLIHHLLTVLSNSCCLASSL